MRLFNKIIHSPFLLIFAIIAFPLIGINKASEWLLGRVRGLGNYKWMQDFLQYLDRVYTDPISEEELIRLRREALHRKRGNAIYTDDNGNDLHPMHPAYSEAIDPFYTRSPEEKAIMASARMKTPGFKPEIKP